VRAAAARSLSRPQPVLKTLLNSIRTPEIRSKLLFTAGMLALYRLGSFIPAPGIDVTAVERIGESFQGSNVLGVLNTFSGGSLQRFGIFVIGVMPYIIATIMVQMGRLVVPSLEKLHKEGEAGQQKTIQYARYLTVGLAFGQSIGYVFTFRSIGASAGTSVVENFNFSTVFIIVTTLTAGSVLVMWLGELITQRGIGNGISLMIFASIVAGLPSGLQSWFTSPDQIFVVMMPIIALAVIAAVVFMQEGQRRIPVQYAKRVVGRRMAGGGSTYLPLRVNMAGVMPVIFAATPMLLLPTVGELIQAPWARSFSASFNPGGWAYIVGESILIIVFTYVYTAVVFNPVEQADNLKKHGGFIPGVRPGRPTAEFLDRILSRLTFPGALYLAAVAALPTILISQTTADFFFGGTAILIVVGVALDTMQRLEAQLMMRNYEGFLK
jgi:preprotein translocase subunit SecY